MVSVAEKDAPGRGWPSKLAHRRFSAGLTTFLRDKGNGARRLFLKPAQISPAVAQAVWRKLRHVEQNISLQALHVSKCALHTSVPHAQRCPEEILLQGYAWLPYTGVTSMHPHALRLIFNRPTQAFLVRNRSSLTFPGTNPACIAAPGG